MRSVRLKVSESQWSPRETGKKVLFPCAICSSETKNPPPAQEILERSRAGKAASHRKYRQQRSAIQKAKEAEQSKIRKERWAKKPGDKEKDAKHKRRYYELKKQQRKNRKGTDDGIEPDFVY